MEVIKYHRIPIKTHYNPNTVSDYKVSYHIYDMSKVSEDKQMILYSMDKSCIMWDDIEAEELDSLSLVEEYLLEKADGNNNITRYIIHVTETYINTIFQFIWIPYLEDFDI